MIGTTHNRGRSSFSAVTVDVTAFGITNFPQSSGADFPTEHDSFYGSENVQPQLLQGALNISHGQRAQNQGERAPICQCNILPGAGASTSVLN
jgi:hypothetical protein